MKKTLLLNLFLVACIGQVLAQHTISGRVIGPDNKPAEFVNVLLTPPLSKTPIQAVPTDSLGQYTFPKVATGKYLVWAIFVGCQTNVVEVEVKNTPILVGDIALQADIQSLDAVTVVAKKPFIEQQLDRLVVNVSSSSMATGATALEILQRVPGIMVLDDKINMSGKNNIGIMINGRLSRYTDMNALLRDMPSSSIEKIEVITNPSAKYDAEGEALINIITRRDKSLGTNGTFSIGNTNSYFDQKSLNSNDHYYYRVAPSLTLNHVGKKWAFFGYYSATQSQSFNSTTIDRFVENATFRLVTYKPRTDFAQTFRIGTDYSWNNKNSVGLVINGMHKTGKTQLENTTDYTIQAGQPIVGSFLTYINTNHLNQNLAVNLNYKHKFDSLGRELTFDADHVVYRLANYSNITGSALENALVKQQDNDNPIGISTLKLDYTHPLSKKWLFEVGGKTSFANIDNQLTVKNGEVVDLSKTNHFLYNENVNATYANFKYSSKKWRFQTGLRGEQTVVKGSSNDEQVLNRNYWQPFVSSFLSRNLVSELSLNLSFTQRITRPSFQQQNPFELYMDSLTYTKGNPFLRPELATNGKLSLTFANNPVFSVSYNRLNNVIFENAPRQEGNKTFTTVDNLGSLETYNIEANFPITLGKVVSGYGGNQVFLNRYRATHLGAAYNAQKWNWLVYTGLTFRITSTFSAELYGYYMTPFLREFMIIKRSSTLDIAFRKTFWEKRGKLALNLTDILYMQPVQAKLKYQNVDFDYFQRSDSRNVRLSFSYSFGNNQLKARKEKTNASESEQNRVKLN